MAHTTGAVGKCTQKAKLPTEEQTDGRCREVEAEVEARAFGDDVLKLQLGTEEGGEKRPHGGTGGEKGRGRVSGSVEGSSGLLLYDSWGGGLLRRERAEGTRVSPK